MPAIRGRRARHRQSGSGVDTGRRAERGQGGGRPPDGEMVRFRTTLPQWLARGLIALVVIPAALFGAVYYVGGQFDGTRLQPLMPFLRVIVLLWVLLIALRIAIRMLSKGGKGIDADVLGIRPTARQESARFTPWPAIVDIRVRRSPLRRQVVVHTDRGGRWRLPVPYSGFLLAHDPAFPSKVEKLREMWRSSQARTEQGPYAPADQGPIAPVEQRPDGPAEQRPHGPAEQRPHGPAEQRPHGPAEQGPIGPVEQGPYGPEGPAFRR